MLLNTLAAEAALLELAFIQITEVLQTTTDARVHHRFGPVRGFVRIVAGEKVQQRARIDAVVIAHHAEHVIRFLYQRAIILGVRLPDWFLSNQKPNVGISVLGGTYLHDTMLVCTGLASPYCHLG